MSTPSRTTRRHRDAPDAEDEIDLGLREIGRRLVGGDAVFVEAAELGLGVVERHGMAEQRQAMRADRPAGPAPTTATLRRVSGARAKGW